MVDNSEFFNIFASRKGTSLKYCNTRDGTYCNIIASTLCNSRIGCRSKDKAECCQKNFIRTLRKILSLEGVIWKMFLLELLKSILNGNSRHVWVTFIDVVDCMDKRLIYEDSDMLYCLLLFTYKDLRIKIL